MCVITKGKKDCLDQFEMSGAQWNRNIMERHERSIHPTPPPTSRRDPTNPVFLDISLAAWQTVLYSWLSTYLRFDIESTICLFKSLRTLNPNVCHISPMDIFWYISQLNRSPTFSFSLCARFHFRIHVYRFMPAQEELCFCVWERVLSSYTEHIFLR